MARRPRWWGLAGIAIGVGAWLAVGLLPRLELDALGRVDPEEVDEASSADTLHEVDPVSLVLARSSS